MKKEDLLADLEQVAKDFEYTIRYEKGDFSGGSCLLKQQKLILINKRLPLEARLALLARSLSEFDLDSVFIKPIVREFIDDERARMVAKRSVVE